MAIYRLVHISFWQDSFILDLTPEEKFFYLYLMTNSKTKQCGVYELPKKVVELETGYNRETVDKLMCRFVEYGKIEYCEETREVCLNNWFRHNSFRSPKVMTRIERELKEIKCERFKEMTIHRLSIDYEESIESPSIPKRNKNQNQNQNQNKNKNKTYSDDFELFWSHYPRKEGKDGAYKHFKRLLKDHTPEELIASARNYGQSVKDTEKKFIKRGYNFFGDGLYSDYIQVEQPPTLPCHRKYSDLAKKIGDVP